MAKIVKMKEPKMTLSESYEEKIKEMRKELPERTEFTKLFVYKGGKKIDEFQLKDWEGHTSLLNETNVNANSIFRDQFPQFLINAGYGVEIVVDEAKFEPRLTEYAKREGKLLESFYCDLVKKHKSKLSNEILDKIYVLAKKFGKQGSWEFIEEAYVDIKKIIEEK